MDLSEAQLYFMEHRIEERINAILNEMAVKRPADGMRWLAQRLRSEDAGAGTAPFPAVVDEAVGASTLGRDLQRQWDYVTNAPGASPSATTKAAAAERGKQGGGGEQVQLVIESFGQSSVLLAVRAA